MVTNYVVGRIYDVTWIHSNTMFAGSGVHYIEFEQVNLESFIDTIVYDVLNDVEYDFNATNVIFSVTDNGDEFTITIVDEDNVSHTYVSSDFDIKFKNGKCIHNEFFNLTSDPLYIELLNGGSEHFCLYLYNLTGTKIIVDKSSYLTNSTLLNGQLTGECDLLNPSILIDYDNVFSWNYCFIPSFNRYYFISKITSVRKGLWRIDLHVDVLYTFESDLRLQSGLIKRINKANTYGNNYLKLVDDRLPLIDVPNVNTYELPYHGATGDISFSIDNVLTQNVVLSVIENSSQAPESDTTKTPSGTYSASGLPNVQRINFRNQIINSYIISYTDLISILNIVKGDDAKASFIANIIALPFNLPSGEFSGTQRTIYFGNDSTGVTGNLINSNISKYLRVTQVTINDTYYPNYTSYHDTWKNFLLYDPFTQVEIYIPYYGWAKLSPLDVVGKEIAIYYTLDYLSGSATANVYSMSAKRTLFSSQCNLGVIISASTTNQREITTQKNAIGINTALSVLSSAISVGIGFASDNPVAIAGGIISGAKSVVSAVNQNAMLFDRAQVNFSDGISGLFAPQKVQLRISYREIVYNFDDTSYHAKNGYPQNMYVDNLTAVGYFTIDGYTEVEIRNYTPSSLSFITSPEIDEIVSLAKDGIIL